MNATNLPSRLTLVQTDGRFGIYQCSCGSTHRALREAVVSGNTRSCGCLRKDAVRLAMKIRPSFGSTKKPGYASWTAMRARCNNKSDKSYPDYGGRGIKICAEWDSFLRFYEDMGPRPVGTTIERINNDLGYFKGNCRWATTREQNRNKRSLHYVEFDGRRALLIDFCRELGLRYDKVHSRLTRLGWPVDRCLTTK